MFFLYDCQRLIIQIEYFVLTLPTHHNYNSMDKQIERYDFEVIRRKIGPDQSNAFVNDNMGVILAGNKDKIDNLFPFHAPLMLDEARIVYIRKGEADYTFNLIPVHLTPNTIVFLNRGGIVEINQISDDFEMAGISLSDYMLTASFGSRQGIPLINQYSELFLQATDDEVAVIENLLQSAWKVMHQEDFCHEVVGSIFAALLHYVNNLHDKRVNQQPQNVTHSHELFIQFIQLVNQHSHQERQLSFYADKLCLSQRYMGTIIKQESGKTAKEWIDKAVMTDAQVLLKHTDKTIAEISNELNFANPSFFCKYFRRLMGLSPQEYREK